MGYVPQFENDLFISYRHASNEAHDKWIDAFCEELGARLVELVGNVTIWRDKPRIRAGDQWRPEIAAALDTAAIFLAIISKTYLDSDVCRNELDRFLGRAKDATAAMQRRIVPIFKNPPKSEQELPPELTAIHRHEFFQWDPQGSTRFREFGPDKDGKTAHQFWETFERLAQDLMNHLETLKGHARGRAIGTVYLASAGPELHGEREKLRSDLQQRGYLVVPEREYLWNACDCREKIAADLGGADLCVHLIARTASIERETPGRARAQLALATGAMEEKAKPPPLVWIQPASETTAAARELIDYVERDLSNEGVEYWEGSLEDFKTHIYDKLPRTRTQTSAAPLREIALLVEEGDLSATGDVNALLADKLNLEPKRIKFSASVPKDASCLAKTLAHCGHCVVFWGAQSEEWVSDLLALDALAGHVGKERLCVYAAAPATPEKSTFRSSKARTIQATSRVNEAELREFLVATEAGR